jgi:hypothetical protein
MLNNKAKSIKSAPIQLGDVWKGWTFHQTEEAAGNSAVFRKVTNIFRNDDDSIYGIVLNCLDGTFPGNYTDISKTKNWRLVKRDGRTICKEC